MRKDKSYTLHDGANAVQVDSFTMVPKRIVDASGSVYHFGNMLHDKRMFPDRDEADILWHVFQQVAHFDGGRQVASGQFSVNTIKLATGLTHKAIWPRLAALQTRKILEYRAGKGTTERGAATINMRLDQWLPPAPKEIRRRPTALADEDLSSS